VKKRVAVFGLALCASACPGAPPTVVYDLARRVSVADRWSGRDVILFGTPAAEPHQAEGFYREGATPAGDGFAWSKGEAELSLSFPRVTPRTAVVDLAPYRGVKAQTAEVRLNDTPVSHLVLNDGRHRYRISLPAAAQRAGDNRLRFQFAATASPADTPGNPDRRQLAAAFYGVTVGEADDAGLEDLLARDAPRPFAVVEQGGVPALVQMAPSVARYVLRLPAGAELRFTPRLHAAARAAGASAALRVTLESRAGEEKELWSRVVDGRAGRDEDEVSLRLPGGAGDIVRLGLHVGAGPGARFAWAVWTAPRVLGQGAAASNPLDPPPLSGEDQGRAQELRRSLQGANVLLIVLDAARARSFGAYGHSRPTTPEVDRIAGEGVVFERAYTPAVYTLGAMSSLWTSQYPDRHHAEVSYADRLPADKLTLAEALSAKGVHTAGFIANPMAGRAFGFERGFGEFEEVYARFPDLGSRGEAFRRVLRDWFRQNASRRFFAYVHFREPHFPYDPGPPFDTRFGPDAPLTREQRRDKTWYTDVNQGRVRPSADQIAHLGRLYDGNLAYADHEVGRLRQSLEQAGLWDKTVVIVTADHGEQLYEHGYISHSAQVYEESTHVPLIVRFPGSAGQRGKRMSAQVDLLDIAPTVLDVLGAAGPGRAEREFQGRSLLPVLAGAPGKDAVVSRTVWERPVYGLRDGRFKYIHDTRTGAELLFDLDQDPGESHPLQSAEPLRAAYYRQMLHDWMARLRRPRQAGGSGQGGGLSKATCAELGALGYLDARCR
jgi:arylsulfatase A-like enzyme